MWKPIQILSIYPSVYLHIQGVPKKNILSHTANQLQALQFLESCKKIMIFGIILVEDSKYLTIDSTFLKIEIQK